MDDVAALISKYGFPIIAAIGLGYGVYYVWNWVTKEINPVISITRTTLIGLVDRIRMLDNDLIRLNEKVEVVLQFKKESKILTSDNNNSSTSKQENCQ